MGTLGAKYRLALVFTTILLAALFAGTNSTAQNSDNLDLVTWLRGDVRATKMADKLEVNPDREFRLVVPGKCEDEGELELAQLASTATLEESYAYIPSLCLWVEVGWKETRGSLRLDSKFIETLHENFSSIVLYHIHVGDPASVAGYFPAYADLITLILVDSGHIPDSKSEIIHRAVSRLGVIEYKFDVSQETRRLIRKFHRTGLADFISQNLAYYFAQARYEEGYYAEVRQCERLAGGKPENLGRCFPMQVAEFELRYQASRAFNAAAIFE